MKVAWVTHHIPRVEERHGALLPGKYAGGAERNTDYMIQAAPAGVEVTYIEPEDAENALDGSFDRVVVGGTDKLSEASMNFLAASSPIVWVQHAQHPTPAKRELFRNAERFITMSRLHRIWEAEWTGRADCFVHSPVPSDSVRPAEKEDFALFAGRAHPAKGKINARIWAQRAGVPLVELENAPHEDVIDHMQRARWFVHLPKERDACPLVVIEATLACCQIITNPNLVGRLEPGDPIEILDQQPARFWRMVTCEKDAL
jgi:hypothetical protein